MKKIVLLAIIFLLTLNSGLFSQNMGYLGKRVLLNMDVKISPVFSSPTYFGSTDVFSADFTFSPNIEFIINNKGLAGIAFNYLKTQYVESNYFYESHTYPLKLYGAGLYYKLYFNRKDDYYQAPFGVHALFEFDYLKYYTETFNSTSYTGNIFGIRAGFGVDYMLTNRIRLSWNASLGLTNKGSVTDFFEFDYFDSDYSSDIEDRVAKTYFFHNKIGIGILLF